MFWLQYLFDVVNSNKDCFRFPRLSSTIILSMIYSVSEGANNIRNFYIHWCTLTFYSMTQKLPSCLIQPLVWYVLFHWTARQIMIMQSKLLFYFFLSFLNKMTFSTVHRGSAHSCIQIFNIACHFQLFRTYTRTEHIFLNSHQIHTHTDYRYKKHKWCYF